MNLPHWFPWMMILASMADGYRILGMFPFQGKSHFIMFEALMKGLARKGHQVDAVTPFPQKKPFKNYNDIIVIPAPRQLVNNISYADMKELVGSNPIPTVATMGGSVLCEYMKKPEMQELIKNPPKDPPYDLVMIEFFGAPCFGVLGLLWDVPVIGVSSSAMYPWMNDAIGNPENFAIVVSNLLNYPSSMNFWQRLHNVVDSIFQKWYFNYLTTEQNNILKKYVGPGLPDIREIEKNLSMVLVNTHMSLTGIKPMTPALIEVGGLHVRDDGTQIPPALERWMNESKHGFVYFTFGSMVKIETFPRQTVDIFYKSLAKIAPVRVLMKVPSPEELPPGLPKNVHTEKWMSQFKVLSHPNIKAFITHGGLMGTQEAVYCGVPMIGIPLFADQFRNIDSYVDKNIAIRLEAEDLTQEAMDNALHEILHNPVYRETVKKVSQMFKDRPMTAMDTAIFWVEYIARHGHLALRSPALDLAWWQVNLFDVYAFILLALTVILAVIGTVVKFAVNIIFPLAADNKARSKKVN